MKILTVNGLKLIYQKTTTNNNFALLPVFTTGSISETNDNSGITHFLEHMLGKETKTRSYEDISKIMQKYFPRYNATTSTHFMKLNCVTSVQYADLGFEFFSDILHNSVFSEEKVEKEKKVIEQEIVRYDAENDSVAYELMEKTILKYPFAQNGILGDRNNVLNTTGADLEKRFKELACKENLIFSFAGNMSLGKVKKLLKKHFSSLPSRPENKITPETFKLSKEEKVALIKKESERCNVILVQNLDFNKNNNFESLSLNILKQYLIRMTGSLWNKLREDKGLVYSYYVGNSRYNNVNILAYDFETSKENINECLDCYAKEIKEILEKGISKEDFETIKNNFVMQLDSLIDNPYNVALSNALTYIRDVKHLTIKEQKQILKALNLEDFNNFVKKLLNTNYLSLIVVGNVEQEELPTIDEVKEMFKTNYHSIEKTQE